MNTKSEFELSENERKRIKTYNCPECDSQYNLDSLRVHYAKLHKKSSRELCAKLFHDGVEPTCNCGCGGKLYYFGLTLGFGSYIKGHHVREIEKNPWNKERGVEAKKKSIETKMKLYKEGKFKFFNGKDPWNKGKRKATDPEYAERIKFTDTEKFKTGQRIRLSKAKRNVPKGAASHLWRGGVSSLNASCRASQDLYNKWTYPKLKEFNFSCYKCGIQNGKLEVHHDKETFSSILRKIAKEEGWLEIHFLNERLENPNQEILDLKEKISKKVVEYHVNNNVSGVPLCENCHQEKHPNYNISKAKQKKSS